MNIHHLSLLFAISTTIPHACLTMTPELATKTFIYNELKATQKYNTFLLGTLDKDTIFDIVFPLVENQMSNTNIYNYLVSKNNYFIYQGKQESFKNNRDLLIGRITGFVDALRNQLKMFAIIMQGIVMAPEPELTPQQEAAAAENWNPDQPKSFIATDKNIAWAQEEFMIELSFYILEFSKEHNLTFKTSWKDFKTWLKELDQWSVQQEFNTWITKTVNHAAKYRKALPKTIYTIDNMIFFIEQYIPQKLIVQDQARTAIEWDVLKKEFPGFNIYENSHLYNLKDDPSTKKAIKCIVEMINTNITTLLNKDAYLGKVMPEEFNSKKRNKKS